MFKCPYLSYTEIGNRAASFLKQYHPSQDIPIPVEEIIELKLELNIFPFPRLYKDHGLNGFLSYDLTTIYVDEVQFNQFNEKYRYTLAHELGHYVLHRVCYEDLIFQSIEDYVNWRMTLPTDEVGWFETQGEWFAGQLLVPSNQLIDICKKVVAKHEDDFKKLSSIPDDIWSYISIEIADYFDVNPPVVENRIKKENIPAKINIKGE
jgi:Zn-dependent peptidase ImmA (M78 family)